MKIATSHSAKHVNGLENNGQSTTCGTSAPLLSVGVIFVNTFQENMTVLKNTHCK